MKNRMQKIVSTQQKNLRHFPRLLLGRAEDCFHSAVCWLPGYDWQEVHGFTPEEIARYQKIVESTAHLILQFSQEGGVENAAGF
mgnify:CR=1 FL=1